MVRRAGFITVIAAMMLAGTLPLAFAANSRFQQGKVRRLKACVGIIPTMGEPVPAAAPVNPFATSGNAADTDPDPDAVHRGRSADPNPYIFYVLDQRKDLRPDGWEFYNPAAPAYPTDAMVRRWNAFGSATGGPGNANPPFTVATPLKPDMGAYWEVNISQANYDRLAEMDLIYIPIGRQIGGTPVPTFFTEEQRRVLARLADSGVTVWIDWATDTPTMDGALGGNENPAAPTGRRKNAFFTNVDFRAATGNAISPTVGHPLLTAQFVFQPGDSVNLGKAYGTNPPSRDRAVETRALDMQPTMNLAAVVPTSAGTPDRAAYVAAGRYGAGYVIATAGNVGGAISGFIPANVSRYPSSPPPGMDLGQAETEDLKFAYNAFAWNTEVTNTQKSSRHTGQSSVALDGMIEQGNYPNLVQNGSFFQTYPPAGTNLATLPPNPVAPLIVNGLAIGAVRTLTGTELSVFELNPNDDYDGNGFIDDPNSAATPANSPLIDYSVGQNYDRVEGLGLGNAVLYGMTVGELPDVAAPQGAAAFLFAGGTTGLISAPAPRPNFIPNWSSTAQTVGSGTLGMQVSGAPAFALLPGGAARADAKLYAGGIQTQAQFGSGGRVVGLAVAATGAMAPEWYYPPNSESNKMGFVAGPLTTAQVLDTGTGQVDTMVFSTTVSPNLSIPGGGAGQQGEATGRVDGFIIATRGEPLTFPVGNQAGTGSNPNAGRRFVGARLVNIPPGQGQAPNQRDLLWDPGKYYEVRVMDKSRNYVLARFVPGTAGFNLLPDGTAGQVELPEPSAANGLAAFSMDPTGSNAKLRNQWNLNDFVLLADYSVLPATVDNGLAGQNTIRPRFSPATPYVRQTAQTIDPTGVAGGVSVGKDNLVYYGTGKGYMCAVEWRRGRPTFRWKMLGVQGWGDQGSGQSQNVDPTNPAYLQDYAFVSAPAAGNRIVFTSRGGTAYVFEPDATIRCKLAPPGMNIPWSAGLANEVVLQGDHGLGILPNQLSIMATQAPWGRSPNQFTVDTDTGTLTFLNMENFALDLSQALSPAQCLAAGVDTGGRPGVPLRWWFRNTLGNPGLPTVSSPATTIVPLPLVAVYHPTVPVNDNFLSGPVLSKDKIFILGQLGWLHELPMDPKTLDPNFPRRTDLLGNPATGLRGFDLADVGVYGAGLRRVKNVAAGIPTATLASPALTNGMVVTNTPRGLTFYASPNVVIADSNRVVEASGNSTALAATDTVIKHRMDISEFAIPSDPNFADTTVGGVARPVLTERKLLSRPSVVRKLDRRSSLTGLFTSATITDAPIDGSGGIKQNPDYAEDSYLVADTGNNRVVEFNPAGKVVWEADQIYDPMDYIPAGEPLKLSGPMDAQRWVETEVVGGTTIYVIHTLIADTGNTRVVEIVDKVQYTRGSYGPNSFVVIPGQVGSNGQPFRWYHVVVWSSQTNAQGLKLRYRTAQRVYWPDSSGNRIPLPASPAPANPGAALTTPPFLPKERALSYVMASITGQQVYYPGPAATPGSGAASYFQFYGGTPNRAVLERKPEVRSGSDSIVFLRGSYKVDESNGGAVTYVPTVREGYPMGFAVASDQYRYAQGIIEPNLPILTRFNDELAGGNPVSANPIHYLNGVSSVQLTIRSDIKFAPETYGGGVMPRYPYILVADTDGVWEGRVMPSTSTCFLSWAFTVEDYAYVTGAGNGDPTKLYSTNGSDHTPGGRRLNAASARRLQSGVVLVSSRIPANDQPRGNPSAGQFTHLNIGSDVFMLRPADYRTAGERAAAGFPAPYNRQNVLWHGWQPDQWVQTVFGGNIPNILRGAPSIRWRAAEQINPNLPPTLRTQIEGGTIPANPAELTGTYIPVQPIFADIAY